MPFALVLHGHNLLTTFVSSDMQHGHVRTCCAIVTSIPGTMHLLANDCTIDILENVS